LGEGRIRRKPAVCDCCFVGFWTTTTTPDRDRPSDVAYNQKEVWNLDFLHAYVTRDPPNSPYQIPPRPTRAVSVE